MQSFNDKANPPSDLQWLPTPNEEPIKALRVLVACEFSGTVRDAFLEKGHDAWSCDMLPAEHNSNRHIQSDVRDILNDGWDFLIVAHPPCTRLCNSGVRWLHKAPPGKTIDQMWKELREGAELFSDLWNAPIPHICVENPVMHSHAKKLIRNYVEFSQSVQPWQFGHPETKRTCFWLKNLPPLRPTNIVEGREARVHKMPPSPDRWRRTVQILFGNCKSHVGPMARCCDLHRPPDEAHMTSEQDKANPPPRLQHRPISLEHANSFVHQLHRHHKPVRGHKFSIAAMLGGDLVGVAIIGRPVSRIRDDGMTLELTRLCTIGTRNACSFLMGKAAKATFALGFTRIGTYILQSESGVSLRAAGWTLIGETKGGSWDCPSRPRTDKHPTEPKTLWELCV